MTQSDKDLLLKDLCSRLPYGVKAEILNEENERKQVVVSYGNICYIPELGNWWWKECKPYLFPMSSMTEEQKYDFYYRFIESDYDFDDFKEYYLDNGMWHKLLTTLDDIESIIDWLNKNHFDYRGLIEKGLANDATNLNIYQLILDPKPLNFFSGFVIYKYKLKNITTMNSIVFIPSIMPNCGGGSGDIAGFLTMLLTLLIVGVILYLFGIFANILHIKISNGFSYGT